MIVKFCNYKRNVFHEAWSRLTRRVYCWGKELHRILEQFSVWAFHHRQGFLSQLHQKWSCNQLLMGLDLAHVTDQKVSFEIQWNILLQSSPTTSGVPPILMVIMIITISHLTIILLLIIVEWNSCSLLSMCYGHTQRCCSLGGVRRHINGSRLYHNARACPATLLKYT